MRMPYVAIAVAWASTGVAVALAVYMTGSAWCLLAMAIPASIEFSSRPQS